MGGRDEKHGARRRWVGGMRSMGRGAFEIRWVPEDLSTVLRTVEKAPVAISLPIS